MKTTRIKIITVITIAVLLTACNSNGDKADGYGNFEATEITISAENTGKLMAFTIDEGTVVEHNQLIGYIDTIPLYLKKEQLLVQKDAINSKSKGVLSQIDVLQARLKSANINKTRVENLIRDNAGTQKQLDDVQGEIDIIKNQIRSVEIQNAPVVNELKTLDVQLQQVENQIQKSKIVNPINGTVLSKYAEANEIVAFGKPLYKIADLSTMELRVYVSETQLAKITIGESVSVKIDDQEGMKTYEGTISWIASEAEFTPKIIQTKEERVALVYAVKIQVKNDGSLKIGMPAEMWLNNK
ncbi:HlyD family efflux transporter periplasmic adaptor subunit [Mangrovimonas sp. AS39]|uniref:HlyD family secretion protein n=1 Tax=Mangrovimonas futianensis TaxID=2895523 RepID=UPI001E619841|nr:HlyD family efflux transporter periplasmic adaptor subunit [Mangrovimonas futianensis]MCF1192263.1 HlyD family efflux transporter periplasmic adaptor subunit [Mangrovimonas futianensis]MCF1195988.1 HlyD family efflux transporter periplasmic adaptor subunit [Mangrovimonas futianensis]